MRQFPERLNKISLFGWALIGLGIYMIGSVFVEGRIVVAVCLTIVGAIMALDAIRKQEIGLVLWASIWSGIGVLYGTKSLPLAVATALVGVLVVFVAIFVMEYMDDRALMRKIHRRRNRQ